MHPALLSLFGNDVQGFVIDLFRHDPAGMTSGLRLPILVVQGARDLQTTPADVQRLGEANPAAGVVLLADTNHVMKTVESDDRAVNRATYADPSLPLAPSVAEAISTFIRRHDASP